MGPNHYLSVKLLNNRAIFSQSSMQYEIFSFKTNQKKKKTSLSIFPIPNATVNELAILFSKTEEEEEEVAILFHHNWAKMGICPFRLKQVAKCFCSEII